MRRVGSLVCLGLLVVLGCSGGTDPTTAENSPEGTASTQVAAPQFAPTVAAPAPQPRTATAPVGVPMVVTAQAPGQPPVQQTMQPTYNSVPQQTTVITEAFPAPPGTQLDNEQPISHGTPGTPPGAVARGFVRGPGGQPLLAYRMPDGQIVRVISRMTTGGSSMGPQYSTSSPQYTTSSTSRPARVSSSSDPVIPVVEPDSTLPLPGDVNNVAVGGSGRYLLLSFFQLQKVGVFDVRTGKVVKYVNVDSDQFSVAGGGTQFVVVNHPNLKLEAWKYDSLDQPRLQATLGAQATKKIATVAMGLSSEGPLGIAFTTSAG
jgi:hypothetical protein